jgi:spore maturation protein CgeB
MNDPLGNTANTEARVLLHSQRGLFGNLHFRLALYEFEDIICVIDSIDLLAPEGRRWFKHGTRIANRLATSCNTTINPGIPKTKVQKNYDLFFAVVYFPSDLLQIKYLDGWKNRCRTSICWLSEIWAREIVNYKYYLKVLAEFDYVLIPLAGSIKPVQEVIDGKCLYLPTGVDAILFCPYPNAPQRVIDVYSIGRKSEETHRKLLKMAYENRIYYVYDTIDGEQVRKPREHRFLFANTSKRSRYFIVNPGKRDDPGETGGQIEFGNRFFEGAASGSIMIGETPENEQFKKIFDWPDAVINLPFGSENIDEIIIELDKQPDRQEKIRRCNVVKSLLNHDWVYRWESILRIAGLDPMPELLERKNRLRDLSAMADKAALP